MKITRTIPVLCSLLAAGCVVVPPEHVSSTHVVSEQFITGSHFAGTHLHIGVHSYPELVLVPGLPVYYAPRVTQNYFFYDGLYWVFEGDHWYASEWYGGPWNVVRVDVVPVYLLRVPVYYYRRPPVYFRTWHRNEPPRWGERWGRDWERRRPDWRPSKADVMPPPAPLPDYQRHYRGRDYPTPAQQRELQKKHYRYVPRERGQDAPASREEWQRQQEEWQERRDEQRQRERLDQLERREPGGAPRERGQDDKRRQEELREQWRDEREQARDPRDRFRVEESRRQQRGDRERLMEAREPSPEERRQRQEQFERWRGQEHRRQEPKHSEIRPQESSASQRPAPVRGAAGVTAGERPQRMTPRAPHLPDAAPRASPRQQAPTMAPDRGSNEAREREPSKEKQDGAQGDAAAQD